MEARNWKRSLLLLLLIGLASVWLISCGGDQTPAVPGDGGDGGPPTGTFVVWNDPSIPPSRQVEGAEFVGNGICVLCHEQIMAEYSTGDEETSNDHGLDFRNAHGRDLVGGLGGRCAPCHTTGYDEPSGYNDGDIKPHLEGIGCEECHGPGSKHLLSMSADDIVGVPSAQNCIHCHVRSYKEDVENPAVVDDDYLAGTTPSSVTVHHPQALALYGGTGYELFSDAVYPQSRHLDIENSCVTCHLQGNFARETPGASRLAIDRGHSKAALQPDANICMACHTNTVVFNTMVEGTEHQIGNLLIAIGGEDPANPGHPDENGGGGALLAYAEAWGLVLDQNPAEDDPNIDQYRVYKGARYNWALVEHDGTQGIHNYPYFRQLLVDSLNALRDLPEP